jgi:hypothetical protein
MQIQKQTNSLKTFKPVKISRFTVIENALACMIWLNQIWFGYYFGKDDAKASSIPARGTSVSNEPLAGSGKKPSRLYLYLTIIQIQ